MGVCIEEIFDFNNLDEALQKALDIFHEQNNK